MEEDSCNKVLPIMDDFKVLFQWTDHSNLGVCELILIGGDLWVREVQVKVS